MLSIKQDNIEAIPMDCSFDECQKLVKDEFVNDKTGNLMTVNSINIGRIIAQIVYYFWTYLQLDNQAINVYVPTGNFGNIFAGFLAKQMRVKIDLNICVNENDTLYRFYQTGIYQPIEVITTQSNAIDITNPSNFERILWYLSNDKNDVMRYISDLKNQGFYKVSEDFLTRFRQEFNVHRVDHNEMKEAQKTSLKKYNVKLCPHTAVALSGFMANNSVTNADNINVIISTADCRKFE